jgi:hypothetical protein
VEAAAEGVRGGTEGGEPEQPAEDGAASGQMGERLIQGAPRRTMERDLGVGEHEARHALVDQGELAGDPAPGVVADESVGVHAELREHPLRARACPGEEWSSSALLRDRPRPIRSGV